MKLFGFLNFGKKRNSKKEADENKVTVVRNTTKVYDLPTSASYTIQDMERGFERNAVIFEL